MMTGSLPFSGHKPSNPGQVTILSIDMHNPFLEHVKSHEDQLLMVLQGRLGSSMDPMPAVGGIDDGSK